MNRGYRKHRVGVRPGQWSTWRLAVPVAACLLALAWLTTAPSRALAACGNPVACENQLPGDPPCDWEVTGAGDSSIQGYATQFSVNAGQTISFKIKTPSTNYHIDILRLGYYGGDGARKIAANIKPTATLPQTQPACQQFSSTGLIDCGNWSVSASWTVPSTAVSGVYIAHLVRDDAQDPGGDSQIPFVVRNDSSHSDIVVGHVRCHLAGLQRLRRQQPLHVHGVAARPGTRSPTRRPTRSPTTVRSTVRSRPTAAPRICTTPSIR